MRDNPAISPVRCSRLKM